MSLFWFRLPGKYPASLTDLVQQLEPFGIELRPPSGLGVVYYRDDESNELVKEIGELFVNTRAGYVRAKPRRNSTEDDRIHLLKAAEVAFREKPTRATGWVLRRRKATRTEPEAYWRTTISTAVTGSDADGWLIRASETVEVRNDAAMDALQID